MVFAVMVIFLFLSACKKPDPIIPIIPELKLPTVNTVDIRFRNPTSVEVNTEIISDGGESISSSGLCWAINATPTIKDFLYSVDVKIGTCTFVISNLQLHTVYYFSAYATNKNGTAYGQSLKVFDPFIKAIAVIKSATKVTLTTATVAAVLIPGQDDTSASFEYREELSSDWKSFPLVLDLMGVNLKDSLKLSYNFSGLKAGTDYRFRIKAVSSAGEITSDEGKFSTYAAADFDGNFYHAVEIGGQTWLQENLQTTRFLGGYAIVNVKEAPKWEVLISGVYSWYNNLWALKSSGALYNYYAAISSRGFIKGWHVPTQEEWTILSNYLKSLSSNQATALPIMATGSTHWSNLNSNFIVTNTTGFTALPNGRIFPHAQSNDFVFAEFGLSANFWSASVSGAGVNYSRIDANDCILNIEGIIGKNCGLGIRLIKDK